jgi:hypothetical protein
MPRTHRTQTDTAAYERAHGRSPRGYGAWWFTAVDPDTRDALAPSVSVTANYSEARLLARARLDAALGERPYDLVVLS